MCYLCLTFSNQVITAHFTNIYTLQFTNRAAFCSKYSVPLLTTYLLKLFDINCLSLEKNYDHMMNWLPVFTIT